MSDQTRKPIGVSETDQGTTVVCDDGSCWYMLATQYPSWYEYPPIPGTARDLARQAEAKGVDHVD